MVAAVTDAIELMHLPTEAKADRHKASVFPMDLLIYTWSVCGRSLPFMGRDPPQLILQESTVTDSWRWCVS